MDESVSCSKKISAGAKQTVQGLNGRRDRAQRTFFIRFRQGSINNQEIFVFSACIFVQHEKKGPQGTREILKKGRMTMGQFL